MIRKEGLKSLWNGVTASCLRELTYSTVRFGLYETFKDAYAKALGVKDTSFALKALSGISSGAIGSAFACPTDLVKGNYLANSIEDDRDLYTDNQLDVFCCRAQYECKQSDQPANLPTATHSSPSPTSTAKAPPASSAASVASTAASAPPSSVQLYSQAPKSPPTTK